MKKLKGFAVCYALSALLLLGFIVNTLVDYIRYDSALNSAPFYIWIAANALCFLVPALTALIIGAMLKKKQRQ